MDIGVTQQNNRLNSRENNVILGANPVLLPFSLAPESTKFDIYREQNLPFWRAQIQLRSDVHWSVKSLQPFSSTNGLNPVQYPSVE